MAPDREDVGVCVEGLFTGDGLADLCAHAGMPFVLGHALDMQAIHGGKATHDRIDAHKLAVLRRGGMIPQADVYPAEMRATRALLRRRLHRMRHRAGLRAPIHHTTSPYNLPQIGKKLAYQAHRGGGAQRWADPAVQQSLAVDLPRIGSYDRRLTALERELVNTATGHGAQPCSRLRSLPGVGNILALVRRDAIHAIHRFPRGQACVSSGRLLTCAQASAGKRYGTAGATSGHASLTGAFSEAAVLVVRNQPAGPQYRARLANKHGQGQALTVLAPHLARAVSDRWRRATAVDLDQFFSASGSGPRAPAASLDAAGISLRTGLGQGCDAASLHAPQPRGLSPCALRGDGTRAPAPPSLTMAA
jgi:hypothetical protein